MPYLARFLSELIDNGHVRLSLNIDPRGPFDESATLEPLRVTDQIMRSHLGGKAPEFVPETALWAANTLFLCAWLFLNRNATTDVLDQHLASSEADPQNADHVYSVDLSLRFLPDLWQHVAQRASQDPLALLIRELASRWPLSSVGMAEIAPDPDACSALMANPPLRQLYVDRILRHDDAARLQHPGIMAAIRSGLGSHLTLAPINISIALETAPNVSLIPNDSS